MNIFLAPGVHCYYVPEYMDRSPLRCKVLRQLPAMSICDAVFELESGLVDSILPKRFFVEINDFRDARHPDKITDVRVYTREDAWFATVPRSEVDIVEQGFVCTWSALSEFFPQITVPDSHSP